MKTSIADSLSDFSRGLGVTSVTQMQKFMAEADLLSDMSKYVPDYDSIAGMSKYLRDYDSIATAIEATERSAFAGTIGSAAAAEWDLARSAISGGSLASSLGAATLPPPEYLRGITDCKHLLSGSVLGSKEMYEATERANRETLAAEELTILTPPPPLRFGPSLVDVMEKSDRQQDKRHREQLAQQREIAEENDRRSEEIDARERAFNSKVLRISITLGLGGAAVGAWTFLVPYIFG
jgi:hypothetical protein